MCDFRKYSAMYDELLQLQPEDTLQLILQAKSDEERKFFTIIGDMILQKRQLAAISENKF